MNKQELRDKIVKEEIKKKWHTAENLPKYFGIDMIVVDYSKTRPHITLESKETLDLQKQLEEA